MKDDKARVTASVLFTVYINSRLACPSFVALFSPCGKRRCCQRVTNGGLFLTFLSIFFKKPNAYDGLQFDTSREQKRQRTSPLRNRSPFFMLWQQIYSSMSYQLYNRKSPGLIQRKTRYPKTVSLAIDRILQGYASMSFYLRWSRRH